MMEHPYSPKSSPRGSRSPSLNPMSDSHPGNLKLSIALGQKPTIIQKGPFYLIKPDGVHANDITGATNLMASKGLEHSYIKLTTKKMKDSLSSFLPNLPGIIDTPGSQDNSALRGLIEKPPIVGKELHPLNQLQLAGFRLHPGPLPEQYRGPPQVQAKKKHKHKKHRHKGNETPAHEDGSKEDDREKRREKKHKRHEKDEERKKKKKEKKKKKNKEDKDG